MFSNDNWFPYLFTFFKDFIPINIKIFGLILSSSIILLETILVITMRSYNYLHNLILLQKCPFCLIIKYEKSFDDHKLNKQLSRDQHLYSL